MPLLGNIAYCTRKLWANWIDLTGLDCFIVTKAPGQGTVIGFAKPFYIPI